MDILRVHGASAKGFGCAGVDGDVGASESGEEREGVGGRAGEGGVAVDGTDS